MLIQLLQFAVVAWLPGAVIFRLPIANRTRRGELDAEERLFWAVILSLCVSLSVVLGLAAFGQYSFERLLMIDAGVALLGAVAAGFRLRLRGSKHPGLTALLPLTLVLLGCWRFFPPAEYIIGGKDPGVYINEGIQIAQRGSLVYDDPLVASVPPFTRDLFFPSHQRPEYYGIRFMGFFIRNPDAGTVVGQFPHLFPASIALGYGIDGLTGARRTVGFWAILGLLAVYFTAARIIGRTAAFAAAALLALHVLQVWFARYPNAEVVMQALLFAALLATARAHVDGDPFFGPVAAMLLGLLLFLRIDTALGIAGVIGGLALLVATGGVLRPGFVIVLGVLTVIAGAYYVGPMRAYVELPIVFVTHLRWWQYAVIASAIGMAAAGLVLGGRNKALSARVRSLTPRLLIVSLLVLAVYALYFRQPGGKLAAHDANALRTFTTFYLTLPGLIAALLGYTLVARRAMWRAPALFTTVALFSVFFFYKIRVVPEHFWLGRRFVPVILPAAMVFAAAAAAGGTRGGLPSLRSLRWAIGAAFMVLLGWQYARVTAPILSHIEYAGVIPRLEQLAGSVGDGDLLLVESRDAATDVHTLALPLAYIYARNVLVLSSARPDKTSFGAFLQWAHTKYSRVLFMGAGGTDLMSRTWSAHVLATDRFQVPEYDSPLDEYPRFAKPKQFDYTIYELTPSAADEEAGQFVLDVGVRDDLNVLRFYAKEETEGRTFRWSRDASYIIVNRLAPTSRTITLWMSNGGRPPAAPAANVTILLESVSLGTVLVDNGFEPYRLEIPASLAQRIGASGNPAQFKLTTTVWKPEQLIGTADDRELGVMVDRVEVK